MKFINAEVLKYWIKSRTKEGQKKVSISTIMNVIDCQKPEKLESVVYCKDCVFATDNGLCLYFNFYPYTDDFCSRGKSKRKPPEVDPSHPCADSVMMGD